MDEIVSTGTYGDLIADVQRILVIGRERALTSVARERFLTYHAVGAAILARQREQGWGSQVITRLAADLRVALPDQRGLGARNLQYMCTVAHTWPDGNRATAVARLPWGTSPCSSTG